jgi:signal transduction histidine kinase
MAARAQHKSPANRLESRRNEVIERFERQLELRHRSVACRPDTRQAVLTFAAGALDEMISAVRGGDTGSDRRPVSTGAADVPLGRPAGIAHALADFLGIAATTAAECVTDAPDRLAAGLRTLNAAVSEQVGTATTAARVAATEELREERRHLARSLHDRLGTDVKVAHQHLELYELLHDKDPERAHRRVVSARQSLDTVLSHIRQLAFNLRFDEELDGLEQSLRGFLGSVETEAITPELVVTGDEAQFPPLVRNEIYLAVREAVTNALLHSRGRSVAIMIDTRPDLLRAVVRDDGIGLPSGVSSTRGTGMASMAERVSLVGGSIHIEGSSGNGTRVEIVVPAQT